MKLKIVHTVFDDKFIDGAISLFETDERVQNTYVFWGNYCESKYLHSSKIEYISVNDGIRYLNQFDVIIIHSLSTIPLKFLGKIRSDIKVVWFAWGYDLYESPYNVLPLNLYGPETSKYLRYEWLKDLIHIRNTYRRFILKKEVEEALNRINYFSGVFPYEIYMIKAYHPSFTAQALDFYYGAKDFFIPEIPEKVIKTGKHDILLGNSADMSGNHLDVLKEISSKTRVQNGNLIIPLSYGGPSDYINKVISEAETVAPGHVTALTDFLPLNKYIELISNCKAAVFGHERQQASDNIFMQMIYGARVFMSESSAAFVYLKSMGLKVYSIQSEIYLLNEEMSEQDVMINRTILSSMYSSSKLIERIHRINSTFLNQ